MMQSGSVYVLAVMFKLAALKDTKTITFVDQNSTLPAITNKNPFRDQINYPLLYTLEVSKKHDTYSEV